MTRALLAVIPPEVPNAPVIRKNIAYNLQYLAYLDLSLVDLNLSSVLIAMTCKSYVVVGTGILEAVLFALLKHDGASRKSTGDLSALIASAEDAQSLGDNPLVYGCLDRFRDLRNRVHQQKAGEMSKSDYNSFDIQELALMKALLNHVLELRSSVKPSPFSFLKLTSYEYSVVKALLDSAA